MILQAIRSALYYVQMFLVTAALTIMVVVLTPFPKAQLRSTQAFAHFWSAWMRFMLRWLIGIRTEVEGVENIPEGAALVASKHQSDWDVLALYPLLDHPAFIAKKELFDIPTFGTALRTLGIIQIDRKKGASAVPAMIEQAKHTVATGRKIFIFSEGTRRAPFDPPNYRTGTARLYEALNVPIVPVALNSGLCWGRNSLILWPGTARAKILEPIPPGLPVDEVQELYSSRIEEESIRMALEEIDKGVARPLDEKMRLRIEQARADLASKT